MLSVIIYFTLFALCVNIYLKTDVLWLFCHPWRNWSLEAELQRVDDERQENGPIREEGPKGYNAVGGYGFQTETTCDWRQGLHPGVKSVSTVPLHRQQTGCRCNPTFYLFIYFKTNSHQKLGRCFCVCHSCFCWVWPSAVSKDTQIFDAEFRLNSENVPVY